MLSPLEPRQPIEQVACPKCDLKTPGWRKRCIHCGRTICVASESNQPRLWQETREESLTAQ